MVKTPKGVTLTPIQLKYRIRNFFRRTFTSYCDDKIEGLYEKTVKYRHLAYYWEQVARGDLPFPLSHQNVQTLADNEFYVMIMKKYAQYAVTNMESRFKITVDVPADAGDKEDGDDVG